MTTRVPVRPSLFRLAALCGLIGALAGPTPAASGDGAVVDRQPPVHASDAVARERRAVPELFKYGFVAFAEAYLHHHSGLAGDSFRIDGAIFANDYLFVVSDLTVQGPIVSGGLVKFQDGVVVEQGVFANAVSNDGTLFGPVTLLAAVSDLPPEASRWDLTDLFGNKHRWYLDANAPGAYDGTGTSASEPTSATIGNGEIFASSIFAPDGRRLEEPDPNVVHYLAPPMLDYAGLRAEAERNDDTYFPNAAQAISYLISHKVTEILDGKEVTTVRVGSPDAPELLYVDDDFEIELDRGGGDNVSSGQIDADAIHIEGGIYVSGDFTFDHRSVVDVDYPGDYPMLRVNALPYCYPALVAYRQPCGVSCAFDPDWQPDDTPAMTGTGERGSSVRFYPPYFGPAEYARFDGLIVSQEETHLHATTGPWVRVAGSILARRIHLCDWVHLEHAPEVACTRFVEPRSLDRVLGPRVQR